MNKKIEIELPLPKIERKILSLNVYRNLNHWAKNKAKRNYAQIVCLELRPFRSVKFDTPVITYTLFSKTKRRRDLSNFCSIIDKFFCDALVDMNMIEDDDCTHLQEINYRFGGYGEDKVVVVVEELKEEIKKQKSMWCNKKTRKNNDNK